MAVIELGENVILIDGVDVTASVSAWRLDRVGNDVPTIVLEMVPGAVDRDTAFWSGYTNVRFATPGIDVSEFLAAVDGEQLTKMMLEEGDMSEDVGPAALRALRGLAQRISP